MKIISNIAFLIIITFLISNCKSITYSLPKFDFGYQDKWQYFKLDDTLTIKVINHLKAEAFCGNRAFASITIGMVKKDTIRIINLCNMEDYDQGDIIKFVPMEKPTFSVSLPYSTIYNTKEQRLVPGFYDLNIIKTTYGSAIRS